MTKNAKKSATYTIWIACILVVVLGISVIMKYEASKDISFQKEEPEINEALQQMVLSKAPRHGALSPQVVIAEFGDFQCVECKNVAPIIEQVMQKYPQRVQRVWIHVINASHPESESAAIASYCAHQQNQFWKFHDLLFENQDNLSAAVYNQIALTLDMDMDKFRQCLADDQSRAMVELNLELARQNEVKATPHLNINNEILVGSFTTEELESIIVSKL